ncbi:MAG: PP2C family protein-serine/threonine phosphatase [Candidatus Aminicenantes bacterium]|nr:MAG: PP2C family protein-serine/threonine phosphatase [Candidatus Aminicenantes bacterium]
MEEKKISHLTRELKLKQIQFNSIFEFSESIYSSFQVDNIIRIYFSTLMGQLGISRIFFLDSENHIFEKKGFRASPDEQTILSRNMKKLESPWFYSTVDELPPQVDELTELLKEKKIRYLVNISESDKKAAVLGLGAKFNQKELTTENIEYAFFVSKFSRGAIENAILINRLIESKRMEHELKIARDIQLSLLPQSVPTLKNFDISVIYEPTNEVGGDYYDILKKRNNKELPILIADVEGKGLPAALLAASSQAIFHSLNELYLFEPGKFISKANTMICEFTRGNRFITLFWMLLDDDNQSVTYVNAGHVEPLFFSKNGLTRLSRGGFLAGFVEEAQYEKETIKMAPGDLIVTFTDGVPEVENKAGQDFGVDTMIEFIRTHRHLSADELTASLFKTIKDFSQNQKFRDDFTLIVLKAK